LTATRLYAIEDYGLIGDTRTAALAAPDGSLDWMCVPRFDGRPVFGRLVGGAAAGHFTLGPARSAPVVSRAYRTDTATLETTWDCSAGRLTLTEGMIADVAGTLLPSTLLVRRLTTTGGPVQALVDFDPRLGEHHRHPRIEYRGDVIVCSWGATALAVTSSPRIRVEPGQPGSMTVTPEQPLTIAVAVADRGPLAYVRAAAAYHALEADEHKWRRWAGSIDIDVSHRDLVRRSALTLRLLTYSPSGAPVAAATTSLPEDPGGIRNWDYRFAWPRDASIGIGAFLGLSKVNEARRFLAWLLHASRLQRPRLPVLLTVHGRRPAAERELDDWPGYRDSRPVRVGNAAADQHQLDGYGWVLDAAWLLVSAGYHLYSETWRAMRASPTRSRADGGNPMPASGKSEARPRTTCIPSSWHGSRSIGRYASRAAIAPRRDRHPDGNASAMPSPPTSPRTAITPSSRPTSARTARLTSTPRYSCSPSSASSRPTPGAYTTRSTPSPTTFAPAGLCSTATRQDETDYPAARARSYPAPSGSSRPSPRPGDNAKHSNCGINSPGWQARSAFTPKKSTPPAATTSGTTPKPSLTPHCSKRRWRCATAHDS
jgi:hypothetical protein